MAIYFCLLMKLSHAPKSYTGKRPFENFKYEVVGTDNILRPKNFVTANKMEANS